MSSEPASAIGLAATAIAEAEALLITAGAGMGVDSGLPDFRGNEGFWRAYPPIARLGISFFDMANPIWFKRNPELAWGFYGHRLNLYRTTHPHRGFAILRRWADSMKSGAFVFTSNVDGHFQRAGFDSDRVVECHGSIRHLQCTKACRDEIREVGDLRIEVDDETLRAVSDLPLCPGCGSLSRPNVLMFNDWNWLPHRTNDQERRFERWLHSVAGARLAIVELGAGSAVPTVRMTSERLALRPEATLVRINPREPEVPYGQISLPLNALEALEALEAINAQLG
ncbi:MAG: Sir2 family NAD-dependent protein deacetylase [Acidobacteriota bacterium]|nr:Sir2 family NAD-dependent protein deacetylase [Acidobacteriota bacterium]